jgi:predicted DNA-binding protein with PD1-like motif
MSEFPVRVSSVEARRRSVVARIWPRTELFEGLLRICEEHDVRAGCITTMLGSLLRTRFVYPVPFPGARMGAKYVDPVGIEGPIELLGGSGFIGTMADDGRTVVHLHCVMSDPSMRVIGGHLLETGNPVMSTVEIMIEAFDDVSITRAFDPETDFSLFSIGRAGDAPRG